MPLPSLNTDRARIARQVVQLLRLVQGQRYMPDMAGMARELGVSRRTVCRYVDAIEQAGWPLPKRGWNRTEAA